ncbi:MAG: hypothetical protein IT578_05870 [Verrucomicrobiae bacterium]|nr:hypothetical protein [Verrucomicrobiae bacterium]
MDAAERELTLKWIETWRLAGPELERIRREEIETCDTSVAVRALDDAFESARLHSPTGGWSGLVEQQAVFAKRLR